MAMILIVDDNPTIRWSLSKLLRSSGYEIVEACDGQEALTALVMNDIDMVLTDLYMPEVDGIELLIRLKNSKRNPLIVAMSGGGHLETSAVLTLARDLGVTATIAKPFTADDLLELIGNVLAPVAV